MKIFHIVFFILLEFSLNKRHHYKPKPEIQVENTEVDIKDLEVYEPPVKVYSGENLDNIEENKEKEQNIVPKENIKDENTTQSTITFDDLQNVQPNFEKEYYYPCNEIPCPSDKGICSLQNRCYCFEDYSTHSNFRKYGNHQCNYERKSQMFAFFLEFILSFGLGHFYLGNISLGLIKFLYCLLSVTIFLIIPLLTNKYDRRLWIKITPYFQLFFTLIFCVWQIIDSVLFGMNLYTDWNDVYPKSW